MVARGRRDRRPFPPGGARRRSSGQRAAAEGDSPPVLFSRTLDPPEDTDAGLAPRPAPRSRPPATPGDAHLQSWVRDHRERLGWAAGLTALFFLVTMVIAFPEIESWRSSTPGDYGDAYFSQWLLRWNVHALTDFVNPFHPNIYWPVPDTLVYSDSTLAATPVAAVAGFIFGWPFGYNVIYVAGWMVSMASAYALARYVGASRAGAILAGIISTFAAVRLGHYGHFPMLSAFLVPLSLLLMLRFLYERRWWQAVALGLAGGATFLNTGYVAVVLFPGLAVLVIGWLIATRFRPGRRFLPGLMIAGVIALALSGPVFLRYRDNADFLRRDYAHNTALTPRNFLAPTGASRIYGWLEKRANTEFENRVFPGALAFALGAVGLVTIALRRRSTAVYAALAEPPTPALARAPTDRAPPSRRTALLLLVLAGLPALVFSFGKFQTILGRSTTLPFSWVSSLPGYQSIRAFGRFTVIPLLGLALLAAFGYDKLFRGRPRATQVAVVSVLVLCMMAEYKAKIVMAPRIDRAELTAVNKALGDLPYGPVVELPMGDSRTDAWAYVEGPRLWLSALDWQPRVNGYSGYTPVGYEARIDAFNSLDDGGPATPEALKMLDDLGIRYLLVRMAPPDKDLSAVGRSFVDARGAARIVAALPPDRVEEVNAEGAALLIRLKPVPVPSRP